MSSSIHSVLVGQTWRAAGLVKREDGAPITANTVNYYLKALTGTNAGKWYRNSDSSWQAGETANAMAHQADGLWTLNLTASPFAADVMYLEYAKESADLHVPGNGRLLRGLAVVDAVNVIQLNGKLTDGTPAWADRPIFCLQQLRIECAIAGAAVFVDNSYSQQGGRGLYIRGVFGDLVLASGGFHDTAFNKIVVGKSPGTLAAGDVTGNLPVDVKLIKTVDADTAIAARVDASTTGTTVATNLDKKVGSRAAPGDEMALIDNALTHLKIAQDAINSGKLASTATIEIANKVREILDAAHGDDSWESADPILLPAVAVAAPTGRLAPVNLTAYQHARIRATVAIFDADLTPIDLSEKDLALIAWLRGAPENGTITLKNYDDDTSLAVGGANNNQVEIDAGDENTELPMHLDWILRNVTDDVALAVGVLEIKAAADVPADPPVEP